MKQKEFIGKLADKLQWDESKISDFIDTIANILKEQLSDNHVVTIEEFGVFTTQKNQEYILVNSETGERFLMPPEVIMVFEPDEELFPKQEGEEYLISFEEDDSLKSIINSAFQNFEPTLLNEGVELSGVPVITTEEPEPEIEEPEIEVFPEVKEDVLEPEYPAEVPEDEDITKVDDPFIESVTGINDTKPEEEPEKKHIEKRLKPKSRSRNNSRVMIPILGGVAIVLATLFFFNGMADKKNSKSGNRK